MPGEGSVTGWIGDLRLDRDHESATRKLWERYFDRLTDLADRKVPEAYRRIVDGEDVALSALETLFRGLREGRYSDLVDREELWRLLAVITARKAYQRVRHARRQKEGGHLRRHSGVEHLASGAPPLDFQHEVAEQFRRLLADLGDETLRQVALMRMEGYTLDEVAAHLGCVRATVARKLRRIRTIWSEDLAAEEPSCEEATGPTSTS